MLHFEDGRIIILEIWKIALTFSVKVSEAMTRNRALKSDIYLDFNVEL